MNLMNNLSKAVSAVGSVGGLAADAIDGVASLGSEAKNRVANEFNSANEEARIENAKSRILAKASAIQEIMGALNISAADATKLLDEELQKPL
nr:MAG TPA: hypothetical protein [Caudoviricetes sp.]